MDQLIQCPVCTLYLHNGMSLETHLDTHPKDQVIKALCSLTNRDVGSNYSSRTPTPHNSEQSYRSRSRTPVVEERWTSTHRENDRYWRKAPNIKASKPNQVLNNSYIGTPDARSGDYQYDNNANDSISYSGTPYSITNDKIPQSYSNTPPLSDIDQQYVYYNETQEDREIKYSRSEQYSPLEGTSSVFTHKLPSVSTGIKMHTTLMSAMPRRGNENIVKILPKPNNIFLKTNQMQYITPGGKPIQMMVSNAPTFVQKNVQNNMFMTSTISGGTMVHNNGTTFASHPLNQISSSRITPGTTVVQNSQIIYRETVHNIDGKRFITCAPSILSQENVTNVSQATSMYQNVVVLDQMSNSSCMYKAPQRIITTSSPSPLCGNNLSKLPPSAPPNKEFKDLQIDNKSIIIEVEPVGNFNYATSVTTETDVELPKSDTTKILSLDRVEKCETPGSSKGLKILSNIKVEVPVQHNKYMVNTVLDLTGTTESEYLETQGKVLDIGDKDFKEIDKCTQPKVSGSNSKMSNTFSVIKNIGNPHSYKDFKSSIVDSKIDIEFSDSCSVPDLICNEKPSISPCSELSDNAENSTDYNTSVSPKPGSSKQRGMESNIDKILSRSYNRQQKSIEINGGKDTPKPCGSNQISIANNIYKNSFLPSSTQEVTIEIKIDKNSPKLSSNQQKSHEFNDGKLSYDETSSHQRSIEMNVDNNSPKPCSSKQKSIESSVEKKPQVQHQKPYRHSTLRLNNILVRKHKKILQIKNAKTFPTPCTSQHKDEEPGSSTCKSTEYHSIKSDVPENKDCHEKLKSLKMITVEKIKSTDDNHDVKVIAVEPSIDIEPVAMSIIDQSTPVRISTGEVQVKEETNANNEDAIGDENIKDIMTVHSIPVNVVAYGNMTPGDFEEESSRNELLELQATSKNKQVSMMNENYFGDNIYADYFTPDRVESFDTDTSGFPKEGRKENTYLWGESSQKGSEFVLTNFIRESYKIAENSGAEYSDIGNRGSPDGIEGDQDSKVDVLSESHSEGDPPLNICTDECMPPRGELSGQESNGDMDSSWGGMYPDAQPSEPYDLIARESWVSDGSEIDSNEKRECLEEELCSKPEVPPQPRSPEQTCPVCGAQFALAREMRAHRLRAHTQPHEYRFLAAKKIKKEDKSDDTIAGTMPVDSKESLAATILRAYDDEITEAKPKIEGIVKEEPKQRRRRDYVCPTCKVDQLTDAAFNAHLREHPLECLTCGKCFFRRANLALHLKTHLGIKKFKCEVCEKRFITKQKLAEHSNIHTGRAPYKCTVCDETFRRYSNMAQHRNRHHFRKKAKVRDFVCQCGAVFHSRAKLEWHRETHESRPKACLYCSDKFVHAASLTRHVRRAHDVCYVPPDARPAPRAVNVPCPVCKQVYLRTNMRAHLQTHSGKRPYPCIVCNKSFTTKWNLKLHRWTHMNRSAKPFKCNLCKGAFIRQSEFVAHMNAHKSVKPYTCNYCGCQFIRKYNCQRHVKEHEMAKKYVCKVPECGKSFHRSYYLSEHMKVHSGARPFSCNICGKTSSNKSNHNKHVKIHHAREPVATEA